MAERLTPEERKAGFVYGRLPRSPREDNFATMVSSSLNPGASSEPGVFRDIGNGRIILKVTAPGLPTTYPVMEWDETMGHYKPVGGFDSLDALLLMYPLVRN